MNSITRLPQPLSPSGIAYPGKPQVRARSQLLGSSFALNQLTAFADRTAPAPFAATMASIFGNDLPQRCYLELQQMLLARQLPLPRYQIDADAAPADYDNLDRTIRIHPDVIETALREPEQSWQLLAILLHEFGHHLDNVLRKDLAGKRDDVSPSISDAAGEEGSRYAHRMALIDLAASHGSVQIATYRTSSAASLTLSVNLFDALQHIAQTQPGHGNLSHPDDARREGFEAGDGEPGKFTHQNIENVLRPLGFKSVERDIIYFGNWMRDYSQLLDPKLVRAEHMPKSFPNVFSRKALTEVVDILSIRRFGHLRGVPGLVNVTPEQLGVYRPSEHIDNPVDAGGGPAINPAMRDPDFERWILPGDAMLEVDPDTSMKRYIYRSVAAMRDKLSLALEQGRTADSLKAFGSALHILEDFFAHSNFIELSLIKVADKRVLPWTSKANCKWELPLVTGTFGSIDVVASMAGVVGDIFFPERKLEFDPTREGHRSEWDKVMLIILGEHHNPEHLKTFQEFLNVRDKWASWEGSEYVEMFLWFTGLPAQLLLNAFNAMMRGFLKLAGSRVDDYQTLNVNDPNTSGSTDPSHSQLSKDHDDHPLHELAALLAKEAVSRVAQELLEGWNGDDNADPAGVATRLICHPMDSSWQDELVRNWARDNERRVALSTSRTDLNSVHKQVEGVTRQALERLEKESREVVNFFFTPSATRDKFFDLLKVTNPIVALVNGAVEIATRR